MAPLVRLAAAFVATKTKQDDRLSRTQLAASSSLSQEIEKTGELSELCSLFGAEPVDLLSLKHDHHGIRGVYLNDAVVEGDVILKMPLSSCLREDEPPSWLQVDDENGDDRTEYAVAVEGWVTRLTACLLEAQLQEDKPEGLRIWLDLLPTDLREILPVHWDASFIEGSGCRPLQMVVDSGYFARAVPIGDLLVSSGDVELGLTQRQIEDALDLVQTRSCRAESGDGPMLRVLVPLFDLINHKREHNAEFFREGEFMVVRAKQDISEGSEVFISYGAAASPAWKCLFSYGFVPLSDNIYEDDAAEIEVDDMRIEVGPTEIPFELVQHEATKLGRFDSDTELEFTVEIGESIVSRLVAAADELAAPLTFLERRDKRIEQSLAALRESNRRTILSCAGGLREYIEDLP